MKGRVDKVGAEYQAFTGAGQIVQLEGHFLLGGQQGGELDQPEAVVLLRAAARGLWLTGS